MVHEPAPGDRPAVAGRNHTCLVPSNNCADNIPELRDLLGHDALGHRLANRLVDEGITTREALSGASPDQVLYWHHVGPSGLKRLHEQGLLGEGTGRALIYHATARSSHPRRTRRTARSGHVHPRPGLAHHRCRHRTS